MSSYLDIGVSSGVTTPNNAAFNPGSTTMEVRLDVAYDAYDGLAAQRELVGSDSNAFLLRRDTGNFWSIFVSGPGQYGISSSGLFTAGQRYHLRWTWAGNVGGNEQYAMYYRTPAAGEDITSSSTSWTQVGSTQSRAGPTTMASLGNLRIGDAAGNVTMPGNYYQFAYYVNGTVQAVADFRTGDWSDGSETQSPQSAPSRAWTVAGTSGVDWTFVEDGQFARPTGTATTAAWTAVGAASIVAATNETPASDSEYARSENSPNSSAVALPLSSLSAPGAGTQTVRYRYDKVDVSGTPTINLVAELREGYTNEGSLGTLRGSNTHNNIAAGFVQGSFNPSGITSWSTLWVRFVATQA